RQHYLSQYPVANVARMPSISPVRCDQRACCTITRVALQLKPALLVSIEARLAPWNSTSLALHGPGTTMIGLTLPSSLVMRLRLIGERLALLRLPSAPTPKTIASCVLSDPVMWISSTRSWLQRYAPSAAPP